MFAVSVLALAGCTGIIGVKDIFLGEQPAGLDEGGTTNPDGGPIGTTDSGGTCNADLATDPKNCGACGHDCLGGGCIQNACQPAIVTLLDNSGQPWAIAVDNNNAFFTDISGGAGNTGQIWSIDKLALGGTPTAVATTNDSIVYDIGVSGSTVVFASGSVSNSNGRGVVESSSKAGGPKRLVATTLVPRGLSISGDSAYFYAVEATLPRVERASLTTSDGGAPEVLVSGAEDGLATWANGTTLYWTLRNAIGKCGLPTCADKSTAATVDRTPVAVTTNTTHVFFGGDDKVWVMKQPSGPATEIATGQTQVYEHAIVADDKDVFWINLGTSDVQFSNGAIMRCHLTTGETPTCEGGAKTVAPSTQLPRGIAMDARAVYWTESSSGIVWRLAR